MGIFRSRIVRSKEREALTVPLRKRAAEWLDIPLKVVQLAALLAGGYWAYFQFDIGGGRDWTINLDMTTEVLPYEEGLRLVVVHVKSKNPRPYKVDFEAPKDSYEFTARRLSSGLKNGALASLDEGELIAHQSLLGPDGMLFLPFAEFDDEVVLIASAGSTVVLSAKIESTDRDGNVDYVSSDRVIQVKP